MSHSLKNNKRFAHSLFYHKRPERIAQGRSFAMSDLSNLLMVAHLSWAIWAIRSQSLICPERSEQIAHSRSLKWAILNKWANTQPWFCPPSSSNDICLLICLYPYATVNLSEETTTKVWCRRDEGTSTSGILATLTSIVLVLQVVALKKNQTEEKAKVVAAGWRTYLNAELYH